MRRFLTWLLAACMLLSCVTPVSAENVASGSDLVTQTPAEVPTTPPTEAPTQAPTDAPTEVPASEPTETAPADVTEAPAETPAENASDAPSETPAEDMTDAPTDVPAEKVTETPAEEVTDVPTEAPSEAVTEISTDVPTEEATDVPTEVPTSEMSPDPTEEPTPTTDYGSGPLYVWDGELKHYGQPEELIPLGQTLYLYHTSVVELEGSIDEMSRLSFALDKDVFTAEDDVIYLSVRDPNGVVKENVVFLWAGKKEDKTDVSDRLNAVLNAGASELLEREIQVTANDYVSGEGCSPTFHLTALPEKDADMTFAVIIDDADPVAISGSSYSPKASGEYRFALLAADGTVLARSGKYSVIYAAPTPKPTEVPTPEPTEEPTEVPTPELTEEPTEVPTPEATEEPTAEPTPVRPLSTEVPTEEPTAEPEAALDDLIASMDSFISANTGSNDSGVIAWAMVEGQPVSGSLAALLESGCDTIYIATGKTIVIEGMFVSLAGVTLLPDPDVFGDDYVVRVSETSNVIERENSLFVSVVRKSDAEAVTAALTVDAGSHTAHWTNAAPAFTLSAQPDLPGTVGGYSYAVSVDGGAPVLLARGSYTAREEGSYVLRFYILDPDGNAVAKSEDYSVKLDATNPLLRVTSDRNGGLMVIAGDTGSGAVSCSLDGGATWLQLTDQGEGVSSYETTLAATTEYAPGQIIVQDRAGNRASNTEKVSVTVMQAMSGGSRGGGSSRSTSHASSTEKSVTVYNGVELILDDGSMSQLTVGDEVLDMYLIWDEAEPGQENASFTASFTALDGSNTVDTLMLTASGVQAEQVDQYTWQFSGLVYKKLAASGIDYLALRVGERVTLLSTAGFSAGIRYSMFRAEGLPSKDFMYTLRMGLMEDEMELDVTVAGETWRLTDDATAEFYYYDVFTGLAAELDTLRD